MKLFAPLVFILFICLHRNNGETWNYADLGPDVWSDTYPVCAGHHQSPINIRTACTIYRLFAPFHLTSTYNSTYNFTLINNGHTIVGLYRTNGSDPLLLTGGGLNGTFEFVSFHLHWGENYKSGSEHQINGEKYAGEIHFVHLNRRTNRYVVLGMFMKSIRSGLSNETIYQTNNLTSKEWKRYFAAAKVLQKINNSIELDLNLAILMGENLNDFWRYDGSLTTPPCTEGIVWTIFKTPIVFTESELDSFRKNLYFEDYRGPQPLFDRLVYRNFRNEIIASIPDYNYCSKGSINQFSHRNFIFLILFKLFSIFFVSLNIY